MTVVVVTTDPDSVMVLMITWAVMRMVVRTMMSW